MNSKGYWFAFAIGVAAGASLALLYAPQTGVKTRRRLRSGTRDVGEYLDDAGDSLKVQAERLSEEAQAALVRTRGQVEEAVDAAGKLTNSVLRQAKSLV